MTLVAQLIHAKVNMYILLHVHTLGLPGEFCHCGHSSSVQGSLSYLIIDSFVDKGSLHSTGWSPTHLLVLVVPKSDP